MRNFLFYQILNILHSSEDTYIYIISYYLLTHLYHKFSNMLRKSLLIGINTEGTKKYFFYMDFY